MKEFDDFHAVHVRHKEIDEGQIHLLMLQETQAVLSTFGDQDTVPRPFERDLEDPPHGFFVIYEQDSRHRSSHPFPGSHADRGTRIICSCSIARNGRLLAEWPGEASALAKT
jgi:hypothetical protein